MHFFEQKNQNWIEFKNVEIINNKYFCDSRRVSCNTKIKSVCNKCLKEFTVKISHFNGTCSSCKRKEYCLENYGVDNVSKIKEVKEKIGLISSIKKSETKEKYKKTMMERFGVEHNSQSKELQDIKKQNYFNKHNVNHHMQVESIKNRMIKSNKISSKDASHKRKKTMIEKYGVEHSWQSDAIKEKIKKTNIERHGEESPTSFRGNIYKKNLIDKYGVDNPWKSLLLREKCCLTAKEKYGSSNNKEKQLRSHYDVFYNQIKSREIYKNKILFNFSQEEFEGLSKEYSFICCFCNKEFKSKLLYGRIPRCLNCFPIESTSLLEKELADWIKSLNIEIIENNRSIISPQELDIYIPSYNLALEFNGIYWHSELQGKDFSYHLNKTNRCLEKGIQLLHIWENEWIEKQDIVKSIIKSKLGLHDEKIGARKCIIKETSNKNVVSFYEKNHIQGYIASKINLCLYYDNELVSCLSFSKPRYNKKYEWEITRFANKINAQIHGSFSKLWNYFIQKYDPNSVITYSDKRLFTGSIYKKYFSELNDSNPNYWYFKNSYKLHSRIEFQKHKLSKLEAFDSNLDEWYNMQANGYDRIWDCGNKVFVFLNNK